jgi:hypothetical protein
VMAEPDPREPHRRGIPEGEDDTEDPQPPPSGHDQQQVCRRPGQDGRVERVPRGEDALTSKGGTASAWEGEPGR